MPATTLAVLHPGGIATIVAIRTEEVLPLRQIAPGFGVRLFCRNN